MKTPPAEKIKRAFTHMYDDFPYASSIVALWKVIPQPGCRTGWTDGPKFGYDPNWVDTLDKDAVEDFVLHESFHILHGHHTRQEDRDIQDWNYACDLAVNDTAEPLYNTKTAMIGDIMLLMPGRGKYAHLPRGLTAEQYYDLIHKEPEPQPEPESGSGDSGEDEDSEEDEGEDQQQQQEGGQQGAESDPNAPKGEGESSGSGKANEPDTEGDDEDNADEEQDVAEAQQDGDQEGEGVDQQKAQQNPDQATTPEPTVSMGDVRPHPGFEEGEEKEDIEREWEETIARAVNHAKEQGDLPGWLSELAEKNLAKKSKIAWKEPLRRFMNKVTAGGGHTYSRPNRRLARIGPIIRPSHKVPNASDGAGLMDTSGSMDTTDLEKCFPEVEGVLRAHRKASFTLYQCDATLKLGDEVTFRINDFPIRIPWTWKGRGGTNLGPAIKQIAEMRKYKWLLVISDGLWNMAAVKDPGIPVLWVMTRPFSHYPKPKFGQIIMLKEE